MNSTAFLINTICYFIIFFVLITWHYYKETWGDREYFELIDKKVSMLKDLKKNGITKKGISLDPQYMSLEGRIKKFSSWPFFRKLIEPLFFALMISPFVVVAASFMEAGIAYVVTKLI